MSEERPSSTRIPHFLATRIVNEAEKHGKSVPAKEELAQAITEVELQTQISGASFIKVWVADPYWVLTTSGFVDVNEEGILDPLEVEFPEGSGSLWVFCAVEVTNDLTQPSLILTFEDKIVAELRAKWGPKNVASGTVTRAQFIKQLVDEVGLDGKTPRIKFVCPSLNVVQQTATSTQGQLTTGAEAKTLAKENKSRGVGAGAQITIKGQKPTSAQRELINKVMGTANSKQSPVLAVEALIAACITENTFSTSGAGLLQFEASTASGLGVTKGDVEQEVNAFLTKSYSKGTLSTGPGGAIEYAQKHPSAPAYEVAQATQGSGAGEPTKGAANYGPSVHEAQAIVSAYGGVTLGKKATGESDVSQLKRGTTDNPDEDSWEAITRLAQQVTWFAFTDGNQLFYMDGPDLRDQKPALYVDIPANQISEENLNGHENIQTGVIQIPYNGTFDNTSFEYRQSHKVKGKIQRKSKISKPSTPSEQKIDIVCDPYAFRAGLVFFLQNSGPFNGRWIVADTTRNILKDTFTTFTLEPPVAPLPEPQAEATGASTEGATSEGSPGTSSSVAEAAKKALGEKSKYVYSELSNRENNGTLFGPAPRTMDCSAFATLCYKAAGKPDPSGLNYKPIGDTATMIVKCKKISTPEPGDLCFYGPSESDTKHVTVYVGGGNVISMGTQGDPSEGPAATMGPAGFLGYFRPA
jgi:hypothetical protein